MDEIRLLQKEDIEVRVAQTTSVGGTVKASLLIYKNARVDMKILDELYGPMGWKRSHRLIGDRLYCLVEVWDKDKKEWVGKEDVGTESNTEAEKGQASDSFKRACFNWGIGRELYTAPKVQVELGEKEYGKGTDGRIRVWQTFDVSEIGYDTKTRTITSLTIVDRLGKVRFQMNAPAQATVPASAPEKTSGRKKAQATAEPKPAPEKTSGKADIAPLLPGGALYDKTIVAHAKGQKAKSGEDIRTAWARMVNASEDLLEAFDHDVATYRMEHGIQPVF